MMSCHTEWIADSAPGLRRFEFIYNLIPSLVEVILRPLEMLRAGTLSRLYQQFHYCA